MKIRKGWMAWVLVLALAFQPLFLEAIARAEEAQTSASGAKMDEATQKLNQAQETVNSNSKAKAKAGAQLEQANQQQQEGQAQAAAGEQEARSGKAGTLDKVMEMKAKIQKVLVKVGEILEKVGQILQTVGTMLIAIGTAMSAFFGSGAALIAIGKKIYAIGGMIKSIGAFIKKLGTDAKGLDQSFGDIVKGVFGAAKEGYANGSKEADAKAQEIQGQMNKAAESVKSSTSAGSGESGSSAPVDRAPTADDQ